MKTIAGIILVLIAGSLSVLATLDIYNNMQARTLPYSNIVALVLIGVIWIVGFAGSVAVARYWTRL